MTDLAESTWPDIRTGALVLVPVGSTEQHGPHLPFETDTLIAEHVARSVATTIGGTTLVTPPIAFGSSGEHQAFAGTVSIGHEALRFVLVELVRSLSTWAGPIVFVNGHGGNVSALTTAVSQLREQGHEVDWVACAPDGSDAHAGFAETSLMLHLRPDLVRSHAAAVGNTTPIDQLLPELVRRGVRELSPNGVLGDPSGATEVCGRELFDAMVDVVAARVRQLRGAAP